MTHQRCAAAERRRGGTAAAVRCAARLLSNNIDESASTFACGASRRQIRVVVACPNLAWRSFAPGQRIVAREANDRSVHLLVGGRVRVTMYSSTGRQVSFGEQAAGEFLGELSAIDGMRRALDVEAVEPTLVATLTPATFHQLVREQPVIAERVLRRLTALVRGMAERVIELSTLGVQNRIHAELLRLAADAGVLDNTARLSPAPTHAEIASRVSTNREQVTREFSALARGGLLRKERNALVVLDVARLQRTVAEVRTAP